MIFHVLNLSPIVATHEISYIYFHRTTKSFLFAYSVQGPASMPNVVRARVGRLSLDVFFSHTFSSRFRPVGGASIESQDALGDSCARKLMQCSRQDKMADDRKCTSSFL